MSNGDSVNKEGSDTHVQEPSMAVKENTYQNTFTHNDIYKMVLFIVNSFNMLYCSVNLRVDKVFTVGAVFR